MHRIDTPPTRPPTVETMCFMLIRRLVALAFLVPRLDAETLNHSFIRTCVPGN